MISFVFGPGLPSPTTCESILLTGRTPRVVETMNASAICGSPSSPTGVSSMEKVRSGFQVQDFL